jgi:hypothetical protein
LEVGKIVVSVGDKKVQSHPGQQVFEMRKLSNSLLN